MAATRRGSASSTPSASFRSRSLLRRGHRLRLDAEFARAIRAYRAAAAAARDERTRRDARMGEALALRGLGRYGAALGIVRAVLPGYRGDAEGLGFARYARGSIKRFQGRLGPALRDLTASLAEAHARGDAEAIDYRRAAIAGCLRERGRAGDFARSLDLYTLAARGAARRRDRYLCAYAACGRANALRMMGRLAAALPLFNEAERRYRGIGDRASYAYTLWARAMLRATRRAPGDLARAARDLAAARRLFTTTKDPRGLRHAARGAKALALARRGRTPPPLP